MTGHTESVFQETWPTYDEQKMKEDSIEIAVQVNGKLRSTIEVDINESKESVLEKAKALVEGKLDGKNIVKEIYVPGKIVNLVVK